MNVPKIISIGGHRYTVIYPYTFVERENTLGMHDSHQRRILIADCDGSGELRAESDILVTLLHEILHAIDELYCAFMVGEECETEVLIQTLANGVFQVLIDNPELLDMIMGIKRDRK